MAEVINMPRLSDTMEEGTVAAWLKNVGDKIEEGEDTLLAIIGEEGEDISGLLNGNDASAKTEEAPENSSEETVVEETTGGGAEIPEGVIVVTMPRLSDTMEEGTVAAWLKQIGDTVEEGDILAEIETDKATMEFESFQSGTLLYIGIEEGETAKVDALLAIIGPAGTDVSEVVKNGVAKPAASKISTREESCSSREKSFFKCSSCKGFWRTYFCVSSC